MMTISNNIEYIASQLGLRKVTIKKNELHCLCINPDHDDRNIGNFSINLTNGKFFCFHCGYSGNIIPYAREHGLHSQEIIKISHMMQDERPKLILQNFVPLDDYLVSSIMQNGYSEYAIDRLKTMEGAIRYNVFQDEEKNPVFIVSNTNNEPIGYYIRLDGKYFLVEPLTLKDGGFVFGQHMKPTKYTVICEDFFSTMAVNLATGYKAVGLMGTQFTKAQIKNLKTMQPLIIAMDGDTAGRLARDKLFDALIDCDISVAGNYTGDLDEHTPENIQLVFQKYTKPKIEYMLYRKSGKNVTKNND